MPRLQLQLHTTTVGIGDVLDAVGRYGGCRPCRHDDDMTMTNNNSIVPVKQTGETWQRHKLVLNFTDTFAITLLHSSIRQCLCLALSDLVGTANHNVEHIAVLHPTTNHSQRHITNQ